MGQVLSFPMILLGVIFVLYAYRTRTPSGNLSTPTGAVAQ
jgi:prolipoprotein diacylglyceryltransferase